MMPVSLPLLLFLCSNSKQKQITKGTFLRNSLLTHVMASEQLDIPCATALELQVGKIGILIPNVYRIFFVFDTTDSYFSCTLPILVR